MASSAYARPSKPTLATERKQPRIVMKNLSKIEPKKLGVSLVAGCCLVLLTYVSFAKILSIYSPVYDGSTIASSSTSPPPLVTIESTAATSEETENFGEKTTSNREERDVPDAIMITENDASPTKYSGNGGDGNLIICDDNSVDEGFPYARPVYCQMTGDVRISPAEKTVYLVNSASDPAGGGSDANGERKVRPFARKDNFLMPNVVEVTLKSTRSGAEAPECTKRYDVPAVIFSVAGYTGNFFHDVADVLVPLFLTSFHFHGEVQYLVPNYKPWWLERFGPVLKKLSNYDVINFDADEGVHCFPGGFLGLVRDRDLIINPHQTRNPRNYSMVDFTAFLRGAYSLKRQSPEILGETPGRKPRMLMIQRAGTRKLLNLEEVKGVAEELGFEVVVAEATGDGDVGAFAALVNSCDVLLAVHGAGLTNQIFLPTEGVVVQIVPWGKMDWMATNFYGQPARDMKLRYVEYYVGQEESSLVNRFPRDHVVFTDPNAIHAQGWEALADIIMTQDVKVNVSTFRPTLLRAIDMLQE